MYYALWGNIKKVVQPCRVRRDVEDIFDLAQWVSFDKIGELAELIAGKMREAGMADVEIIPFSADGKTFYGGWVIPRAYDISSGRVELAEPAGETGVLFDFRDNPFALMMYSGGTPEGGITADIVCIPDEQDLTHIDLKGKVALVRSTEPRFAARLFDAGAIGIIADGMRGMLSIKDDDFLKDAVQWNNYSLPTWETPNRGFGVTISPRQGEHLRGLLKERGRVAVRADIRIRRYDGSLPMVTGRLPGESPKEIVITGHYDEPGADDNCSGVAAAIEAVRAIRELQATGTLPGLKRSIRLLFAMEVRGLQALLATREMHRNFFLGLNADTVGSDQNRSTCLCSLGENFPSLPSFTDDFVAELLAQVNRENPLFRFRRTRSDTIDNVIGEPLIGAPTPQLYHNNAYHHINLDTPDKLSDRALHESTTLLGTYMAFLANAGFPEALWLARMVEGEGRKAVLELGIRARLNPDAARDAAAEMERLLRKYRGKIDSVASLVQEVMFIPSADVIEGLQDYLVGPDRLTPRKYLAGVCEGLKGSLAAQAELEWKTIGTTPATAQGGGKQEAACAAADTLVPVKTFLGFVNNEDMTEPEKQDLDRLGVRVHWGTPMWLQHALFASSGKRTVSEICRDVGGIDPQRLCQVLALLEKKGLVRFRPYLTKEHITSALRKLHVARGDTVLMHSSLSEFGYVAGGADTVIDAVLEVLGNEGTLMLPTFTFSWMGAPPYERDKTPSILGAIPNVFWRRDGVIRSNHPTHSFAATGKHAAYLLEGHDASMPPMAKEGPVGKLVELDGKILMLCRKGPNTTMHAGEYWNGVPYVTTVCSIVEDGRRKEVLVRDMPWHGCFDRAYEIAFEHDLVRTADLGEGTVYLMRAADAVEAQSRAVRETPELLAPQGCKCQCCVNVRKWIDARKRSRK